MKHFRYLIVVLCSPLAVLSQDITGLWKGTILNDSTNESLQYEIVINKEKGKYTGFSHTWFLIDERRYYGVKKIKIHIAKDGKIIIEDAELIGNNYPVPPKKNIRQLNVLNLTSNGDASVLEGLFVTNRTKEYKELTGYINVKKVSPMSENDVLQYVQKTIQASDRTPGK